MKVLGWLILAIVCFFALDLGLRFVPVSARYQITVEIENNGEVQTASTLIHVDYFHDRRGLIRVEPLPGSRGASYVYGVAPIFDLGPKGILIAALNADPSDFSRRRGLRTKKNVWPGWSAASSLPIDAYDLDVYTVQNGRYGPPVELPPNKYLPFVWIPPDGDWQRARQLLYDELPDAVGVRVTRMVYTPDYWGRPLLTRVEPAPEWLRDMREKLGNTTNYYPDRFGFSPSYVEGHAGRNDR